MPTRLTAVILACLLAPGAASASDHRPTAAPASPAAIISADTTWNAIARREYEASDAGAGLQAPNRANALRTYFDRGGARVVDREDAAPLARLRTVSIGRGGVARPVPDGEVVSSGARVEVRRAEVVEWFENTERGLEHGWTLDARPAGDGSLEIEVAVGDARTTVERDRLTLVGAGRRLVYGELSAVDAGGRTVAVHFEPAAPGRARVVVDDAGARYPITIDPTLAASAQAGPPSAGATLTPVPDAVLQGDQENGQFGLSVAGAGDVNGDGFDDVIVGAPSYDWGTANAGAAFVFYGAPGGVVDGNPANAGAVIQTVQLANLGYSVAGAGDVNGDGYDDVVVGARFYSSGQVGEGAAFVFHGGPAGIGDRSVLDADATLEGNQDGAEMGWSVAGAGDVNGDGYDDVVGGAPGYDVTEDESDEGAAFVFHGGPGGVGSGNPANADGVLDGDTGNDNFGRIAAGAGDVNGDGYDDVLIATYLYPLVEGFGAAFVFHGSPNGVGDGNPANADGVLEGDMPADVFGISAAGAGDVDGDGFADVVVGGYGRGSNAGAAFVFHGGSGGIGHRDSSGADSTLLGDRPEGRFGAGVAGAGDINGDAFDDLIVGADTYPAGGGTSSAGAAFVFHGGSGGVGDRGPASADATYLSDQSFGGFGSCVAGVGDTNGDFSADVAVGAYRYDLGQTDEGAVFVFVGPVLAVGSGRDTAAVYGPASAVFFLKNANTSGPADLTFTYGSASAGLVPIKGDWNGDSFDTPGLYDPSTGAFFLKNSSSPGPADLVFTFGAASTGLLPLAGDWDDNGTDTVGLYSPATGAFFLTNVNAAGPAAVTFVFGPPGGGLVPVAGDWDDNGTDTVGLYNPATGVFFLKNVAAPGPADVVFQFGAAGAGYRPLAGDYDGDGRDTVGLYQPASGTFFLTNFNAPGPAALVFGYGASNLTPLVGDWNAL